MSDPSTGRVPPGAALDRIVEKFIDGALACAELTQADVERGGGLTALSWAVVRLELAYQYAGRLLEIEALRAALDAQPPQAPQKENTHANVQLPDVRRTVEQREVRELRVERAAPEVTAPYNITTGRIVACLCSMVTGGYPAVNAACPIHGQKLT